MVARRELMPQGEAQREVEREKRSRDARKEECMGRRLVVRRGGV